MKRVPRYDPYARPAQPMLPYGGAGYQRSYPATPPPYQQQQSSFSSVQSPSASHLPFTTPGDPVRGFGTGGGGFSQRGSGWEGGSNQRQMRRGEESVPIGGGAPRGEQQTRTLFVRNISYHTSERALLELFEKYGDVKRTFNLIDKRGMAFITYYDIRDAEEAKRDLQGYVFEGRELDIHYSIPREDEDPTKNDENNSTIFVRLRGGKGRDTRPPLSNREVRRLFEEWGAVKEVRDCKSNAFQKFVEFYDIRHSAKCLKEASDTHKDSILDVQPAHAKRDKKEPEDRDRGMSREGYVHSPDGHFQINNSTPHMMVPPYSPAAVPPVRTESYTNPQSYPQQAPPPPHYGAPPPQAAPAGVPFQGGGGDATLQALLSLVQLLNPQGQPQPQHSSGQPYASPAGNPQYPTAGNLQYPPSYSAGQHHYM